MGIPWFAESGLPFLTLSREGSGVQMQGASSSRSDNYVLLSPEAINLDVNRAGCRR